MSSIVRIIMEIFTTSAHFCKVFLKAADSRTETYNLQGTGSINMINVNFDLPQLSQCYQ